MSKDKRKVENVVIIGSGPAGYTAAIYAARASLEPLLFEGDLAGGQLMTTTDVEKFPGYPEGITGPELMADLKKQATRFGTRTITKMVSKVDFNQKPFKITSGKDDYYTKAVIIATGASARYLGLESEESFKGRGVSGCATCDGFFYKGRDVLVVGGGDTALEEATFLSRICNSVTLVHRREGLRASKIMIERAKQNPKIKWLLNYTIDEVLGDKMGVTGARLLNTKDGSKKEVECMGIFIAIGHKPNADIFKEQIKLDDTGYIETAADSGRTSLEGIFACGDVQDKTFRQGITAAGSGCMAAIEVERWLTEQAS